MARADEDYGAEREEYSSDMVEIGALVGSLHFSVPFDLTDEEIAEHQAEAAKRRANPIGFAAGPTPRKRKGQRRPGTFPAVPYFDIP